MSKRQTIITTERVANSILLIRKYKVIMDVDLAGLYGVATKRLNEQVKRNKGRFPEDFVFQLSLGEKAEVVANCDHLAAKYRYSKHLPYSFTEHGAIMAAAVLNSPEAIEASIYVVRAFVKLREVFSADQELAGKLLTIQREVRDHGLQIGALIDIIDDMRYVPVPEKRRIGFQEDL